MFRVASCVCVVGFFCFFSETVSMKKGTLAYKRMPACKVNLDSGRERE